MKKGMKIFLLVLSCFASYSFGYITIAVLGKDVYEYEQLLLLLLFTPLILYFIYKPICNMLFEKNAKKIVDVSDNIKKLIELNKKYIFLNIRNKSRIFREREYSVKSFERVLAKDILMYHIENNTDYIREDILNAYKNKKHVKIYLGVFMFFKKKNKKINKINNILERSNIIELSYIVGSKKEILKRNLIAGIARGVGIGIGVTVVTAIIIFLLRRLIMLNIPVIGDYIADIVEIVEKSR